MGSFVNFRNLVKKLLYLLYLVVIVVILMEAAYRFQIIDFYRQELNALNPEQTTTKTTGKKTVLVFGDSFTVQSNSWLNQLRIDSPEYSIINSAITGTSIVETSYVAPGRIKIDPEFHLPDIRVATGLKPSSIDLNWKQWSAQEIFIGGYRTGYNSMSTLEKRNGKEDYPLRKLTICQPEM